MAKSRSRPSSRLLPVYTVRVELLDTRIWRQLVLLGDVTLGAFHWAIQTAMGWTDSHLHAFRSERGDERVWSDLAFRREEPSVEDEERTSLRKVLPKVDDKLTYEYDFGDCWMHEVRVETIERPERPSLASLCTAGEGACPPEDVGGVPGFHEFLVAMRDRSHPRHRELRKWYGKDYDPQAVPLEAINQKLAKPWTRMGLPDDPRAFL